MTELVTSATEPQWYQSTLAAVHQCDSPLWGNVFGCVQAGNGDIWVFGTQPFHHYEQESWPYIGVMTANGAVRYSGCAWAQSTSSWDAWSDGKLFERAFSMEGPLNAIPVGNDMYLAIQDNDNKNYWIKVDINSLDAVKIAGGATQAGNAEPINGAGVGNNSVVLVDSFATYANGHIYWFERGLNSIGPSDARSRCYRLRRMQTQAPYGVETLPNPVLNPTGLPGNTSTDLENFIYSTNTTTNLPNYLNADFAASYHYGPYHIAYKDDGYLYFGMTNDIRRINMTDWTIETFLYGLVDQREDDVRLKRDHLSDFEETPLGAPSPNSPLAFPDLPYVPGLGVPELEGLDMAFCQWEFFDDDTLLFQNNTMYQFGIPHGKLFSKIDLTALIERTQITGVPERVNRANPQWVTIANASSVAEQYHRWNPSNRSWLTWRDGARPLYSNIGERFVVDSDRIIFTHHEHGQDLGRAFTTWFSDPERTTMVLSALQPEPSFSFDVQLSFEGTALKGYAVQIDTPPRSAPAVVRLSRAN